MHVVPAVKMLGTYRNNLTKIFSVLFQPQRNKEHRTLLLNLFMNGKCNY